MRSSFVSPRSEKKTFAGFDTTMSWPSTVIVTSSAAAFAISSRLRAAGVGIGGGLAADDARRVRQLHGAPSHGHDARSDDGTRDHTVGVQALVHQGQSEDARDERFRGLERRQRGAQV